MNGKLVSCLSFLARLGVRALVLALVTAAFFGVPYCWVGVKAQGIVWGLVLTFLLGRFFCDSICPLGILQSCVNFVFHPFKHGRRVCTRLPETKAQRIVRWSVFGALAALLAAGFTGVAMGFLPISIFGKAMAVVRASVETASLEPAFATPEARFFAGVSVAGLAVVMVLAMFGKGRIWCNWVCPFGTIFNLVSKVSLRKDKVTGRCRHCGKCFGTRQSQNRGRDVPVASKEEENVLVLTRRGRRVHVGDVVLQFLRKRVKGFEKVEAVEQGEKEGVGRREAMKGVALLAVSKELTDGGLAGVSLPGVPERKAPVLPPGAGKARTFALKCVGCQLCVANCPGGCLKPSLKINAFGQPEMDFRQGSCIATCVKCGEVCPEGAIEKLQDVQRRNVHMGFAVWHKDLCIRSTEKTECTACSRKCPVQAIHIVKGIPVVDRDACIGCGACEHVCPARPMPAIEVEGLEVQRIVRPMKDSI